MRAQQNALRVAQNEMERLRFSKEFVFSLRKGFEELYPQRTSHPAYVYYQASVYLLNAERNNITVSSFSDFSDKEYALKVFDIGQGIKKIAADTLTQKQVAGLDYFVLLDFSLQHYSRLKNLVSMQKLTPKDPTLVVFLSTLFIAYTIASFETSMKEQLGFYTVFVAVFVPMFLLILISSVLINWVRRMCVDKKIKFLSAEAGVLMGKAITHNCIMQTIKSEEAHLRWLGFEPERNRNKYAAKCSEVKNSMRGIIHDLKLPLEIK